MTHDLERFKAAQRGERGHAAALAEIRAGGKRSHWIWYVFPQLAGLGGSPMARAYGLDGREEAAAYARDAELRGRLLEIARAVAEQLRARTPPALEAVMGSRIDALKLISSMTLFAAVARDLAAVEPECGALAEVAEEILARGAAEGFPPCAFTAAPIPMKPRASVATDWKVDSGTRHVMASVSPPRVEPQVARRALASIMFTAPSIGAAPPAAAGFCAAMARPGRSIAARSA
jgi:uncharacterized protein (DUF1810 family)